VLKDAASVRAALDRRASRLLKKAHLRECGALDRTLNVQKVRLACGRRAPPRIWAFLSGVRVFQ